jgi:tripartite-type tricarboxylate transporter receptor subunit TctC
MALRRLPADLAARRENFGRRDMLRLPVRHAIWLIALGLTAAPAPLAAQSYPSKTIRIISAAAPGNPPDVIVRLIATELAESEGWRIVVENKAGALQTIGAAEALKQAADGYTVLSVALGLTAAPALMPNLGYRVDTDFVPVIKLATADHVLVVTPSLPVKSMAELVALLKREPDKLTFSSGGFGTPAFLAGEMFKVQTGVRATHVPYRALARALADLVNGTNHFQFISPLPIAELVATGKLRALAVTGPNRSAAMKDVPTVAEAGFPDMIMQDWFGLLVAKGTPDDAVARLNAAINKALAQPRVRQAIVKLSAEPAGGTPAEFGTLVRTQLTHWGRVVKESGITFQP